MHELPHRTVVDLQAALAKFGDQPAQGEVLVPATLDQPVAPRSRYLLRFVAANLAGLHAAGLFHPLQPLDRRAVADAKSSSRGAPRKPFGLDRSNNALAKIQLSMLASCPAWMAGSDHC